MGLKKPFEACLHGLKEQGPPLPLPPQPGGWRGLACFFLLLRVRGGGGGGDVGGKWGAFCVLLRVWGLVFVAAGAGHVLFWLRVRGDARQVTHSPGRALKNNATAKKDPQTNKNTDSPPQGRRLHPEFRGRRPSAEKPFAKLCNVMI